MPKTLEVEVTGRKHFLPAPEEEDGLGDGVAEVEEEDGGGNDRVESGGGGEVEEAVEAGESESREGGADGEVEAWGDRCDSPM